MLRTRQALLALLLGCTSLVGCGYVGLSSVDEDVPKFEVGGGANQGGAPGLGPVLSSGGVDSATGGQTLGSAGAPLENTGGACDGGCTRSADSLLVFYSFQEGAGQRIFDRSGREPSLDLIFPEGADVTWLADGLRLNEAVLIQSTEPAKKLNAPILLSQEMSVELWVTPSNIEQDGPARLLSVAEDEHRTNLMLGQEGRSLRGRVRTDDNGVSALPEIVGPEKLTEDRQHLVYTRDAFGREKLYHNSDLIYEDLVGGEIDAWDPTYFLSLGAQVNTELLSRDFLGTYHLVAIYSEALTGEVIRKNYVDDRGRL